MKGEAAGQQKRPREAQEWSSGVLKKKERELKETQRAERGAA